MGTVVEFPAVRVMPVDSDRLQAQAEVVIFPGIRIERREFSLADRVYTLASSIGPPSSSTDVGLAQRLTVAFTFALLRMSFVIAASLRPTVLLVIVASVWARMRLRPHRGVSILGQTENGRLFFSGIHLGLGPTASKGFPEFTGAYQRIPFVVGIHNELYTCSV